MSSLGTIGHWGLSSTFDLLEPLHNSDKNFIRDFNSHDNEKPICILLINPFDIRHIITTISRLGRYFPKDSNDSNKPIIKIYLLESKPELIARDILLLEILFDIDVPLRQRCNTFLEVYGNIFQQVRTHEYVQLLSNQLRNLIIHNSGRLVDFIDFSLLKYREKDQIEEWFKFYSKSNANNEISKYWDHRLRGYYGDRYDHKIALCDRDYSDMIRNVASIIHVKQFKEWRNSGIAFEFGDQKYEVSNVTMLSYTEGFLKTGKEKGTKKEVLGYWGDIVNPPYYSFGVHCDINNDYSRSLFEIYNKNTGTEQHRHHTVEIALYNLISSLWEFEQEVPYQMTKPNDIFSGLAVADSRVVEIIDGENENKCDDINFGRCKIFPMLAESDETMKSILMKAKFENMFDEIFISSRYSHILRDPILHSTLKTNGLMCIETAKYVLPLTKSEQKRQYLNQLDQIMLDKSYVILNGK